MKKMKIIAIGDNVVDCYLDQGKYYPGGNCVNVLVNAKRLGADKADYIGIFGTDEMADNLKKVLDLEGVNWSLSRTVIGKSGQPQVNLTEEGDRIFVGGPKDTVQHIVKLRLIERDLEYASTFDLCHTSCYSSLEEELDQLHLRVNISFDFSDKRDPAYLKRVCPFISYAFFSGSDLTDSEIDDLLITLKPYSLKVIGITRGSKPALFVHNSVRYYQKPLETHVVDTMGAGDSFIAGFLVAHGKGKSMQESLALGAESARVTCGFYGGFGYPQDWVFNL